MCMFSCRVHDSFKKKSHLCFKYGSKKLGNNLEEFQMIALYIHTDLDDL